MIEWDKILADIMKVQIGSEQDCVSWKLSNVQHLLFTCPVAKIIWATVAKCIGASNIPISFEQS
jgi:hypothetical protein